MAIERRFLEYFGPLEQDLVSEDKILAYRAFMYGRVVFLDKDLVRYRIHEKSISFNFANFTKFESYKVRKKHFSNKSMWENALIRQTEMDIRKAGVTEEISALDKLRRRNLVDTFIFRGGMFYISFLISKYFYMMLTKELYVVLRFKLNELLEIFTRRRYHA